MKTLAPLFVAVGLVLLLCAGCPSEKPSNEQVDGGPKKLRAVCDAPATDCYVDCIKRDANRYCPSCCSDQLILCNGEKSYSFEPCKKEP